MPGAPRAGQDDVTRFDLPPRIPRVEAELCAESLDPTVVSHLLRPTSIGDVIAEKYKLTAPLGRGGMGRIFAARHLLLGTTVALKFLHPHLARDSVQVGRFAREARAAATLTSENAARVLDVDHLPSGEPYIVMEYLEGASLETMVGAGRRLSIADAVLWVVQACDALAEAHSRSIIHRDVKPANLFLTTGKSGEPVIKVLDFGLAKSMASTEGSSASCVSSVGVALGTPHYMAPEQVTGASTIDGRTDVWAVGATLYELLTGHLAFGGPTAPVVFDKILKHEPKPLHSHRPEVPASLVAIVERCLMRDPAARFQSVRALAMALQGSLDVSVASPFVAAPLTTERFVRSSAPPVLPYTEPLSLRPSVLSQRDVDPGPSLWRLVLAALAGPALVAGAVAVVMFTSIGSGARPTRPPRPHQALYLTAKSGDATRSKVPPEPEKPERRRR